MKQTDFFSKIKGTENVQILSVAFKINFQIQRKKEKATLTTTNLKLIADLLTNLCWSDIFLAIECVHYFQLLLSDQLRDNFYTVPF